MRRARRIFLCSIILAPVACLAVPYLSRGLKLHKFRKKSIERKMCAVYFLYDFHLKRFSF